MSYLCVMGEKCCLAVAVIFRLRWDLRRLSIVVQNVEGRRPELVLCILARSLDSRDTTYVCMIRSISATRTFESTSLASPE
jgi:hypothetical protein